MPVTFLDHKCIQIESQRLKDSTIQLNNQAINATEDKSCANSVYVHEEASFNHDLDAQNKSEYESECQLKNEDSSGQKTNSEIF